MLAHSVTCSVFFLFTDPATTEIYTLSLHDALPICDVSFNQKDRYRGRAIHLLPGGLDEQLAEAALVGLHDEQGACGDRKSTRLNSSHANISYAVFCLKKKKHKAY